MSEASPTPSFNQDARGMAKAIENIVHFCTDVNVGTGPADECLSKALVANMQYVERSELYSKLFGEKSYIDWGMAKTLQDKFNARKKGNPVGDSVTWCYLLRFLLGDIISFQAQLQSSKKEYRPFYLVYDSIMAQFKGTGDLKTTDASSLSLCIKAFFITNIIGITPISALEQLLSTHFQRTVTTQSTQIMISISSEKFTPDQYAKTIHWLFSTGICKVDTASMDKEVQFFHSKSKEVSDVMKVYSMQVSKSGRPSLLAIVKEARMKKGQNAISMEDGTYNNYFAFTGFTYRMKFPNSLSIHIQQRAYWLASQGDFFQWREYTHDFLHKDLAASLLQYGDIQSPDPIIIAEVLLNSRIIGAPFNALQSFRKRCLVSMPGLERMDMTMNDVFRLYVAAYQNKDIWKEVWKLIKPILSTQIIKDVENYVALNPMDCYSTASVIMYGTCEPPEGAMMRGVVVGKLKDMDLGDSDGESVALEDGFPDIDPSDSASNVGNFQQQQSDTITRASNNRHYAVSMAASMARKQRKAKPVVVMQKEIQKENP